MISHVDEWLDRFGAWKSENLRASGILIVTNTQDAIRDDGLIDTGTMIGSWDYKVGKDSVVSGTPIDQPAPYPIFQNNGFRHHQSGEIVGGTHFAERGADNSRRELKEAWKRKP